MALRGKWVLFPLYCFCLIPICFSAAKEGTPPQKQKLRFGENGEFKILQIADLHFANGKTTHCLDVLRSQYASCSDLNTTAFIQRIILAEKPNLIVFTGLCSSQFLFLLFISYASSFVFIFFFLFECTKMLLLEIPPPNYFIIGVTRISLHTCFGSRAIVN